tara:strand:- start:9965 stop:10672 length:708 start_codon:yes stop_codon:yes gene_type:complete
MFRFLIISFLICFVKGWSQEKTDVYLLPGQGADCRLFADIDLDTTRYNPICLAYSTPREHENMRQFASRIAKEVDTTRSFYLIGVSLGGMIATEISHQLKPDKTIIISSAKNRKELPARYKFQKVVPIYDWIPPALLKKGALFLQPIVEPDRDKYEATFIDMLSSKPPLYFERTIALIVNWNRTETSADIIHIHGTKDHTIPIRNVVDPTVIQNGSHMMTLTKSQEISEVLSKLL